ncbi:MULTISPECIES: hypothetical protein [Pseudomonadota]|jgi:hypothetical protein|uniref:hypothetical protein n=1 Tax=Pseudomonadota TaxID=1224 RepID=UPI000769E848|nr:MULTISPECIES: hypothetical protein [Pseudomonadota]
MRWYLLPLITIATACSAPGEQTKSPQQSVRELEEATARLNAINAEIAAAERRRSEMEAQEAQEAARVAALPAADPEPVDLCYKDYCPCEPPQGGPDMQACDMLQAGIPVDDRMMIAGRAMREARRQIATGDY